jgi:hypothetical protein
MSSESIDLFFLPVLINSSSHPTTVASGSHTDVDDVEIPTSFDVLI